MSAPVAALLTAVLLLTTTAGATAQGGIRPGALPLDHRFLQHSLCTSISLPFNKHLSGHGVAAASCRGRCTRTEFDGRHTLRPEFAVAVQPMLLLLPFLPLPMPLLCVNMLYTFQCAEPDVRMAECVQNSVGCRKCMRLDSPGASCRLVWCCAAAAARGLPAVILGRPHSAAGHRIPAADLHWGTGAIACANLLTSLLC